MPSIELRKVALLPAAAGGFWIIMRWAIFVASGRRVYGAALVLYEQLLHGLAGARPQHGDKFIHAVYLAAQADAYDAVHVGVGGHAYEHVPGALQVFFTTRRSRSGL
jgi:hypothetical protein